jgi:hypothetical protein
VVWFAALAGLAACSPETVAPSELASRTAQSRPIWQSYSEDLKAQLGARPAAEWQGAAVAVRRDGAAVEVSFALSGPWATRDVFAPVLMREPLGSTLRSVDASRRGNVATYRFELDDEAARAPLPWVQVKFPHGERRIILQEKGPLKAVWTRDGMPAEPASRETS